MTRVTNGWLNVLHAPTLQYPPKATPHTMERHMMVPKLESMRMSQNRAVGTEARREVPAAENIVGPTSSGAGDSQPARAPGWGSHQTDRQTQRLLGFKYLGFRYDSAVILFSQIKV